MIYLDANVFILAVLDETDRGNAARRLLRRVVAGEEAASTAVLTLDEIIWVLENEGPREVAIQEGKRLMQLPNLAFLNVRSDHIRRALSLMDDHLELAPRDAIHGSVCQDAGIFTIVSEDRDFDVLPSLDRLPVAEA